MMNGKQRARWLAEIVSEAQRCLSREREAPEAKHLRQAIDHLNDARQTALESDSDAQSSEPP
jgi:hypothetical protein